MSLRRCAIYTRKSSEEGLEQDFNSLDVQREACAAYILSQRHEGWREIETRYDDGGFSGGSMARPALQRLLSDIRRGMIDVVVVYKVDRLTRALSDFARMVEIFDQAGVSFVSVTQAFNTTSSMGRLTLNVLLSFAQFEREVTAERIRDKIAASKRKGMWMGGLPPLGYDVRDRALVVNEREAETVGEIFRRYLALGSVRELKAELDARGIVSKRRTRPNGESYGGEPFSRGALHALLRNPAYVGQIAHKGERHKGLHPPILDKTLWREVQARLDAQGGGAPRGGRRPADRPLDGLLFDAHGRPMRPTHASRLIRSGRAPIRRRYEYYASRRGEAASHARPARLPAEAIERLVSETLAAGLRDRSRLAMALHDRGASAGAIEAGLARARAAAASLEGPSPAAALRALAERVDLAEGEIVIRLRPEALLDERPDEDEERPPLVIRGPLARRQGGRAKPIVLTPGTDAPRRDPELIALVADARRWMAELVSGAAASVLEITTREKLGKGAVSRVLPLAFLAPDIAQAILEGRQPKELAAHRLRNLPELPLDWREQRAALGFAPL